jgi:hypothetical protein
MDKTCGCGDKEWCTECLSDTANSSDSSAETSGSTAEEYLDQLRKERKVSAHHVCPRCGYCPTCGRGPSVQPWYPWQNPWAPPGIMYCSGTDSAGQKFYTFNNHQPL